MYAVFNKHYKQLYWCYRQKLRFLGMPRLTACARLFAAIRPDGTVQKARVVPVDVYALRDVAVCIARKIKKWRFPKSRASTRFSLSLHFSPSP